MLVFGSTLPSASGTISFGCWTEQQLAGLMVCPRPDKPDSEPCVRSAMGGVWGPASVCRKSIGPFLSARLCYSLFFT